MSRGSGGLSRREFMGRAGAAVAAAAVRPALGAAPSAPARKPNILFLMADQMRGDCLGVAGNPVIQTPHLDRLAAQGFHFARAYSSTPSCTPARAALLTGMSPWNHGQLGYGRVAEKYPYEKPQALRDAGYYCHAVGKMHFSPQRNPHGYHQILLDESGRAESPDFRSDYRSWFLSQAPTLNPDATGIGWNDNTSAPYALPEELHPTRWTADVAERFLDSYSGDAPFFLKVSFARPHSPYDPPARFMDAYRDAPLPERAVGDWAARHAPRSDNSASLWHGDLGPEAARAARQGYYGSVSFLDEQIGRVLAALERRGDLENTLILFTADHGDMTGDHHLWRKTYAYEGSAHIPMIVRCPKGWTTAPAGARLDHPVELRDVLPTFLDAAGVTDVPAMDGSSLLRLARDPKADWRPWIDLEHCRCYAESHNWTALTDGRMKYIYQFEDGREQLFDLADDPRELRDLSGVPGRAKALAEWRGRMTEHLSPRGEAFVKNGTLITRPHAVLYSPNYPGGPPAPKGKKT